MYDLYTIGHSTHTTERFIQLLAMYSISAIADVRSAPYSRFTPHFNHEPLATALQSAGIAYVFLGRQLGARPEDRAVYRDGRVRFDLLAKAPYFQEGLDRLRRGLMTHRISLLCAEKDPITCHRMILICRNLRHEDFGIAHIREDGSQEKNTDAERRLMQELRIPEIDLFATEEELILRAYDQQGEKIAYGDKVESSEVEA